jgi:hypothetical protein
MDSSYLPADNPQIALRVPAKGQAKVRDTTDDEKVRLGTVLGKVMALAGVRPDPNAPLNMTSRTIN